MKKFVSFMLMLFFLLGSLTLVPSEAWAAKKARPKKKIVKKVRRTRRARRPVKRYRRYYKRPARKAYKKYQLNHPIKPKKRKKIVKELKKKGVLDVRFLNSGKALNLKLASSASALDIIKTLREAGYSVTSIN